MKTKKRIVSAILATLLAFATPIMTACSKKYDNEKTALTFSTQEFDGIINPFFATSGVDGTLAGITQISMLSNNGDQVAFGNNYDCVTLDYKATINDSRGDVSSYPNQEAWAEDYANCNTVYEFVLKNNVYFSDGTKLTIKDVLFNMYVYLDPVYTGASTMYATNIKGLSAYRTGTEEESEQEAFEELFRELGGIRMANIEEYATTEDPEYEPSAQVLDDIEVVKSLFKQEVQSDWNNAAAMVASMKEEFPELTETWMVFLFNARKIIEDVNNPGRIDWSSIRKSDYEGKSDETIINNFYNNMLGDTLPESAFKSGLFEVVTGWATSVTALEYFIVAEKTEYFKDPANRQFKSISGITFATNRKTMLNGAALSSDHDYLRIEINGVDPKAEWSFAFTVSPMAYYAGATVAAKWNGVDHFGVEYGDFNFFQNQLLAQNVPVGGGAYMATDADGRDNPTYANFTRNKAVYYKRNPHFIMGAPKIKYLRFKVVPTENTFEAVSKGEVHFGEPPSDSNAISGLSRNKDLVGTFIDNMGYGYIGVSAKHIPDINIRKAIMYAMDIELCLDFYQGNTASIISRPMSKTNWASPDNKTPPPERYYKFDPNSYTTIINNLIAKTDYVRNGNGILEHPSYGELKFDLTISGESNKHPMYLTFAKAAQILNDCGFKVRVVTDPMALSKLNVGGLTVWAAAWGSTIDPDMFQVYHMNSLATSIKAWGFDAIAADTSRDDYPLLVNLSKLIDEGRMYSDRADRIPVYERALDAVMELAVELPTYQRKNLIIYNKNIIDSNSLNKNVGPFSGLTDRIWEVSFKK